MNFLELPDSPSGNLVIGQTGSLTQPFGDEAGYWSGVYLCCKADREMRL